MKDSIAGVAMAFVLATCACVHTDGTFLGSGNSRRSQQKASLGAPEETILLQDDFDEENGGIGSLNYSAFANWTVRDGSVDLIGNGLFDLLPGNGLYVDLDGSTRDAGELESKDTFALDPGDYELSFDLAGSQRGDTNTVTVVLADVYTETFTLASDVPLTTYTRIVSVPNPTSGTLAFIHEGGDYIGLLLDNVLLARLFTSVAVEIDIKPGSQTNSVNPASRGAIPVAILSTEGFDARSVDVATVVFGPGEAEPLRGGHAEDVDGDGDSDLLLHFRTQETGIGQGDAEACLAGQTIDGDQIEGCDSITTVGRQSD